MKSIVYQDSEYFEIDCPICKHMLENNLSKKKALDSLGYLKEYTMKFINVDIYTKKSSTYILPYKHIMDYNFCNANEFICFTKALDLIFWMNENAPFFQIFR